MIAYFDTKPSKLEPMGNGSYRYRWDIQQVENESFEETITQWRANEVTVWMPLTSNKITELVLAEVCPVTRELKLVNDYNAAKYGISADDENITKSAAENYLNYLRERKELKEQLKADFKELGIS